MTTEQISHYRILNKLGAGGMGEVWRARDTRLNREVALKVLPADFAQDAERLRRFEQEARATSALNHPNILTVHDFGTHAGAPYLVAELLEGEELRAHLNQGPLPVRRALEYAQQIAAGLAAAHEKGVVHRDLKPENLFVTHDGWVKILDFGLAKLGERKSRGRQAPIGEDEATLAQPPAQTDPGMVMGTASYMSPEQARGQEVDARSDIFSLGVVLYEVLAGRAPFVGVNPIDVLGAILHQEPVPLSQLATNLPAELQRIVNKTLRKDREERYQHSKELWLDLNDLRRELEFEEKLKARHISASETGAQAQPEETIVTSDAQPTAGAVTQPTVSSAKYLISEIKQHKKGLALGAAALFGCLALLVYGVYRFASSKPGATPFQNVKLTRLTSLGVVVTGVSISPDGKFIAYVQREAGQNSLWAKSVATGSTVQIVPPTEAALSSSMFSPDGNYVYYLTSFERQSHLYQIPVIGGMPKKVLTGISNAIAFSPDGKQFAYVRDKSDKSISELVIVNADGSNERILATRQMGVGFRFLSWSPDGKVIAASARSSLRQMSIFGVTVSNGEMKPLLQQAWGNIAQLAWLKDGSGLMMVAANEPGPSANPLWYVSYPGGEVRRVTNDLASYTSVSLTADNTALVTVQAQNECTIWVAPLTDTAHAQQITFRRDTADGHYGVRWTPDGRIIYTSRAGGNPDIWIMKADGSGAKQLTNDPGWDFGPVVSPDGRYIVFTSFRSGDVNLWRTDIDGSNPKQLSEGGSYFPSDLSPDGRWIVFERLIDGFQKNYKVSIDGDNLSPLTDGHTRSPAVSPDGKLIACVSYTPPTQSIKLLILPFEGGALLKTLEGESLTNFTAIPPPHWTPDGRSLIYVDRRQGNSNLWRLPLDGTAPQQVTNFKDAKPQQIWRFDLSRDGKQLVVARGNPTSDVVMISEIK